MTIQASGELKFLGCAKCYYISNVLTRFEAGEVVYIRQIAIKKGIAESVFIKKINIIDPYRWNYQDKDNRIWIENELGTFDEIETLIAEYISQYNAKYLLLVSECSPKTGRI
jgi:hypothetical protein